MAKFCGNCGAPVDEKKKFCSKCGTPLKATAASAAPGVSSVPQEPSGGGISLTKILAIVCCLLLLAGGGFYYWQKTNVAETPVDVKEVKAPVNDIQYYISLKDKYNAEITALAGEINGHIGSDGNLRRAGAVFTKCQDLQTQIYKTLNEYSAAFSENQTEEQKLLKELFDLEATRIAALVNGLRDGLDGRDYIRDFQVGTKASYEYDDVDRKFQEFRKALNR